MRYLSLCLLTLGLVWCGACASTDQGRRNGQSSDQKSTFKTELITASFGISGDKLSRPVPIKYRARAQCEGSGCIPEKTELSFYLNPGPNTIYLSDRSFSVKADGKSYDWQGRDWSNIYHSPPVLGLIKMIRLDQDELIQIANAQKVTGTIAGQYFEWSYKNREPLRNLVAEMKLEEST